ncbi:hypothetical protein Nepgr_016133 [Nepenthes gracilis]|uniref:Uncharacterized protein n=1 Tax=Nepenthes gracilis TaxID=150966 RepID=A0AAD3XR10_NEPGR|nr:hypothetical protein Nepgr_016133 [Nepenthes gracilis]
MFDILAHIAGDDGLDGGDAILDLEKSIMDCMEVFSKGIHRAMVPLDSNVVNAGGVELVESASCYKMITQMDIIKFLKQHNPDMETV